MEEKNWAGGDRTAFGTLAAAIRSRGQEEKKKTKGSKKSGRQKKIAIRIKKRGGSVEERWSRRKSPP